MSVNPVFPVTFNGGQMTDLPVFSGTFDGSELFEVVAPGNEAEGVNYSIPSQLLAALIIQIGLNPVIISDGEHATIGNPYMVQPTDGRIYVNKTVAEPTFILMPAVSTMLAEPLVHDSAGTADDAGNGITVSFSGGQLADGLATVPIQTPYGGYFFRPVIALGKWTLGVG